MAAMISTDSYSLGPLIKEARTVNVSFLLAQKRIANILMETSKSNMSTGHAKHVHISYNHNEIRWVINTIYIHHDLTNLLNQFHKNVLRIIYTPMYIQLVCELNICIKLLSITTICFLSHSSYQRQFAAASLTFIHAAVTRLFHASKWIMLYKKEDISKNRKV